MNRLEFKLLLAAIVIAIIAIAEIIRIYRRRTTQNEALQLGKEEYLKYLKTEYQELKYKIKTADTNSQHKNILRRMQSVEEKIIQIEEEIESESGDRKI